MKKLTFTKMHALGNDFMVIDGITQDLTEWEIKFAALIPQWAHRYQGIGFDQCLIIDKPTSEAHAFRYRIFNADGSEVGQCGNGARCAARFIHEKGLSLERTLTLSTKTTQMRVVLKDTDYQEIMVELKAPKWHVSAIEFENYTFHAIDVGNPHAVLMTNHLASAPVQTTGLLFNESEALYPYFPKGTNVGWMKIQDASHIALRVFERGTGETQACGSGACAAMVCARLFHGADARVLVTLTGGTLDIAWEGPDKPLYMTGNAMLVYDGVLN